jgi:predicted nucleotidyltransferase component of viral defense system
MLILPQSKDAIHKAWLYRLLLALTNEKYLSEKLYFKGGTCAAMLGYLDRFSVDLDFDFMGKKDDLSEARIILEKLFQKLGLEIKDQSKNTLQYFLKYPAPEGLRNTLKVDMSFPPPLANRYEAKEIIDIQRVLRCQTKETMFANKLVALIDRYERNGSIAGRDVYDIHHFFLQGYAYNKAVIEERRKKDIRNALKEIADFIDVSITETIINQDLNFLLPQETFQKIRKSLKIETLLFLRDEIQRLP